MTSPRPDMNPPREIHLPYWIEKLNREIGESITTQAPPPPPVTVLDALAAQEARTQRSELKLPIPATPYSPSTPGAGHTRRDGPWEAQLPKNAEAAKAAKNFLYKGLRIAWNGAQWVAKNPFEAAWKGLGAYSNVLTAAELARWAAGKAPDYVPPDRVKTKWEFSGPGTGMKYHHFDDSWQPFPPPGYDKSGALMK